MKVGINSDKARKIDKLKKTRTKGCEQSDSGRTGLCYRQETRRSANHDGLLKSVDLEVLLAFENFRERESQVRLKLIQSQGRYQSRSNRRDC